jgi:putative two-component system response regulator
MIPTHDRFSPSGSFHARQPMPLHHLNDPSTASRSCDLTSRHEGCAQGSPQPAARGHRVLLLDDDAEVLAGLRATLEPAGYAVVATSSLAEGLALLANHGLAEDQLAENRLDLVLSDIYLGPHDLGHRIAAAAYAARPRVPVILLTGRPSFDSVAEALKSQVAEIVVKPIEAHTLLTACRRTIHEHQLARRNEELEVQNRVLAGVLPRAIEAKDPTTSGHAERVVHYTDALAQRCGVPADERRDLRLAALLHDVGKIGIPDSILSKPGALTPDEREVINRHPKMGFDILASMGEGDNVRTWVYQHHERWDGKGYPEGLVGEEVALPGRILMLAEVYDALAERRSYKSAWDLPRIVALFRDQAGRQFDPDLAHLVADGLERMGNRFFASAPGALF